MVNDGSTDSETLRILETISAKYRVLNQNNQGASSARNTGIATARGEYIIPLDADNLICPAILTEGSAILNRNPEIGMVYGDKEVFGERSFLSRNRSVEMAYILYHHHIDTCAIYRKEMWADVGGYDIKILFDSLEDWMFWLEALHRDWQFQYVDQVFFLYRHRSGSKSRRTHKNPVSKLALTEYSYRKKEIFLAKAEQNGLVLSAQAQELRVKWTWVLAWRYLTMGNRKEALTYFRKSAGAGETFLRSFAIWINFAFNLIKR